MKMRNYIYYILLVCFCLACEEKDSLANAGYLEFGVTKNVEVITKAVYPSTQPLAVAICQSSGEKVDTVKYFTDFEDMAGEKLVLPVGSYIVKVATNRSEKSGFDQPAFAGMNDKVVIKQGETTKTSVECLLTNVKVTTEFTRPVKEKFRSCTASIGNLESGYLSFGMDEKRAGYFLPGYLLVNLTVENKEGVTFKMSKLVENTGAREYYNFIFDLVSSGGNDSGMDFDIKIDTNPTNDEEHTVTIPLPDTGYEQGAPKIGMEGANSGDVITLKVNDTDKDIHRVTFNALSKNLGIQKVYLMASATSDQFKDIPTILNLTDLEKNAQYIQYLSTLGFVFPTDYSDTKSEKQYLFTPEQLVEGDYTFALSVQDVNGQISNATISYSVKSKLSTESISGKPQYIWSTFATLRGFTGDPSAGDCSFKLRKKGEDTWQTIADDVKLNAEGYASVTVKSLKKSTEYEYAFVQGEDEASSQIFKTDDEGEIPNLDFNEWSDNNTPEGWWDSGNSGTGSALGLYSTTKDENGTEKNCVKMYSSYVEKTVVFVQVKKFVAGNIFIGKYTGTDMGSQAAKLRFGNKYTSRPSKLTFDYKYKSEVVNRGTYNEMSGKPDLCHVYIALTTKQYDIDTSKESTFIKFESDENVIAYGEFFSDQTTDAFKSQTIKLKYKQLDKKPTYIVITATSSKYGDYFTGGEGSTLWLDNMNLVFDDDYVTK